MECLVPKELLHTRQAKQIIYELNRNLIMTKEAFLDTNVSNTILQTMSGYLRDKNKSLHTQDIAVVNNCLLLVRNILHIPDNTRRPENCNNRSSPHNHILWNLFRNNLDDVLLTMMGHVNVSSWCNTIVQIIALIYKDQHVVNLQKLLQTFIDSTLSESSDNESNTSPQGDREESKEGDCSDSLENSVENNLSSATSGNGTTPSPPPPQETFCHHFFIFSSGKNILFHLVKIHLMGISRFELYLWHINTICDFYSRIKKILRPAVRYSYYL